MNVMNVKDYGVKSSWDGWRTFAYVSDGTPMGMMPITWANELFKTKKQAKTFIDDLATKNYKSILSEQEFNDMLKVIVNDATKIKPFFDGKDKTVN
jgi:hypothetical protein